MSFGKNLCYYRKQINITQEELAERLYVTRQTVSRWETDSVFPDVETIIKLCDMFDCSMDTLVRGDAENEINDEKENSDDYRYFPDPDILPFCISDEELLRLKESVPELPFEKLEKYVHEWNVPEATARLLYRYRKICDFFEEAVAKGASARNSANLITGTIFVTFASEEEKEDFYIPTTASQFAELVCLLDKKQISFQVAQDVLKKMLKSGSAVREFVSDDNPAGIADEELKTLCEAAIAANAKAAADIQAGRLKAMNALKGFVMKQTKGRADAAKVERMICELLKQ